MSGWQADVYRAREQQWRDTAWQFPPGPDRDACFALADGYAKLLSIIKRGAGKSLTAIMNRTLDNN